MTDAGGPMGPAAGAWPVASREALDAPAYLAMIDSLRTFIDRLAGARPDDATIAALDAELAAWNQRLAAFQVDEAGQLFGRVNDRPGRGQVIIPSFTIAHLDGRSMRGTVRFGRAHLGANWAVHGGIIPALFDEVLGMIANLGRSLARTAYLHVDYRGIAPIEKPLQLDGWIVSEEGRKRLLRGTLKDGAGVCAEIEGLFVALNPGQR